MKLDKQEKKEISKQTIVGLISWMLLSPIIVIVILISLLIIFSL